MITRTFFYFFLLSTVVFISMRKLFTWKQNRTLCFTGFTLHRANLSLQVVCGVLLTPRRSEVWRVAGVPRGCHQPHRSQECPDSPPWQEHQTHIASLLPCSPPNSTGLPSHLPLAATCSDLPAGIIRIRLELFIDINTFCRCLLGFLSFLCI